MSHRGVLELAAKAAGIKGEWSERGQCIVITAVGTSWQHWRPIQDNGDAFGLAMRVPHLNLQWLIAEAFQAHPTDIEAREQYARLMIVEFAAKFGRLPFSESEQNPA